MKANLCGGRVITFFTNSVYESTNNINVFCTFSITMKKYLHLYGLSCIWQQLVLILSVFFALFKNPYEGIFISMRQPFGIVLSQTSDQKFMSLCLLFSVSYNFTKLCYFLFHLYSATTMYKERRKT